MNKAVVKKSCLFLLSLIACTALVSGAVLWQIPSEIKVFTNETKVLSLPLKDITVSVLPQKTLVVGGQSVGVRMDVKGVLVVGLEEIEGEDGTRVNPGLEAGLQIGDSILTIDGDKVDNAAAVSEKINKVRDEVKLKIKRKDKIMNVTLSPVRSADDGRYKMGVWVRDRTAGIGTLTYYDPLNKAFGALGHAITDPDTSTILPVADGELLNAKVESVKQGKAGDPGEIRGIFYEADAPLGLLKGNSSYGIFGSAYDEISNPIYPEPLAIGYQNEIKKGPAYILTTLDGNTVEKYSISIEKINHQTKPDTKSMVIRVTDKRLLEKSGGIVQGMSGSPIVQNDKIIGAVTHVFVNDPEKGYGIFIEWMLSEENKHL
ncbi:SpoIVB peptidase [Bacilliculturomica massiliensis]|uniref:SpoIVB peptidase n=1 Tax=Bacilliculturomica massiliensis TaxID=1917867 RepID=UPI001031B1A0|nr:SpoIVB peptidase [Bacilliculturomica massiliensis]